MPDSAASFLASISLSASSAPPMKVVSKIFIIADTVLELVKPFITEKIAVITDFEKSTISLASPRIKYNPSTITGINGFRDSGIGAIAVIASSNPLMVSLTSPSPSLCSAKIRPICLIVLTTSIAIPGSSPNLFPPISIRIPNTASITSADAPSNPEKSGMSVIVKSS